MSSESNAKVIRILNINSPQEFITLLKNNNFHNSQLVPLMDKYEIYTNGCACRAEENLESLVTEYRNLVNKDLSELKELLQSELHFYSEGQLFHKF